MKLRTIFFALAIALLAAAPSHAQYLAQRAVGLDCGTAQTCTVALSVPVTAGNSLLAMVRMTAISSPTGTTISDSRSNAWILDSWVLQSGSLHILAVYRVMSASAGATSLTVSNSASSTMRIVGFAEVSGLAADPPDAHASTVGSGTSAIPGSLTTTVANDYVIAAAATDNNQTYGTTQPFLIESTATRGAFADALVSQPATLTPAISFGVSDDWLAIAVAYKTSGAASRLPIFLSLHYDDGTPIAGSVALSSLANNTKTAIQTWTVSSTGDVTIYCPIVTTGSYEYDFLDPTGTLLQSYVILPGAFYSLISPAHSVTSTITLSKSAHTIVIPVSFAFQ
jgi:hypothetical protein